MDEMRQDELESLLDASLEHAVSEGLIAPELNVDRKNSNRPPYSHLAMIDLMLQRPMISQNELAGYFGLTPSWVSTMLASDSFQQLYAKRSEAIIDPVLRATAEEVFKGLVLRSQEILMQKLNGPISSIPDNLVLRTLDVASRAAGYGAKEQGSAVKVDVSVHLENMGEQLTGLLRRKRSIIEHETPLGQALTHQES